MSLPPFVERLKQYPLAVISAVLIVVFIVLIFLRGGVVEALSIEESDYNAQIRAIDQNVMNANELAEEVEGLELIVEQINARLFDRNERAININFFYAFEERVDVVISNIVQLPEPDVVYATAGPRELKLHSTLVFNITMKGSFENVLRFLYELHRVDPLIRVADFQLSDAKNETNSDVLDARMRVLVLAQKD